MPNLTINNGGILVNGPDIPNIDLRYGPYNSLEEAIEILGDSMTPGLTIGINEGGGRLKNIR